MTDTTTMQDLYPDGAGYHDAHEPYIRAVAEAIAAAGYPVDDWSAEPNDPRDGFIGLAVTMNGEDDSANSIWANDEVNIGWTEDFGWFLVTVEKSHSSNGRFVYDLAVPRVASPETVAFVVAEQVGEDATVAPDGHPDLDFPEHTFEDDDVAFELALRHYAADGAA